jgi:hypothetical protein
MDLPALRPIERATGSTLCERDFLTIIYDTFRFMMPSAARRIEVEKA